MAKLEMVTLDTLGGGLANETFLRELSRVLENIDDPNTDPCAARTITLTVKFKPEKSRGYASIYVSSKSTLAGIRPAETAVHLSRQGDKLVATEDDPDQPELPFAESAPKVIEGGAHGSHS